MRDGEIYLQARSTSATTFRVRRGLDLPVRQRETTVRPALLVTRKRHAQIGPSDVTAESDGALKRPEKLALQPKRDASGAAATGEIGSRANEIVKSRFVVERKLEHTQLFASTPFDERRRVRKREPNELVTLVQQECVTEP